jgi:hypothetical protein
MLSAHTTPNTLSLAPVGSPPHSHPVDTMKSPLFLSALLASLPFAQANFDIYYELNVFNIWPGGPYIGDYFRIFDTDPDCAAVGKSVAFSSSGDVSGNKIGVHCSGGGCWDRAPPDGIDKMEMHFTNDPLFHWSMSCPPLTHAFYFTIVFLVEEYL